MEKSKKPSDLTKGSSPKNAPELTERELGKVSGGATMFLKLDAIKGASQDDQHPRSIEIG